MSVSDSPRTLLASAFLSILLVGPISSQERSYEEMRAEVDSLFSNERFAEAEEILSGALDLYPDHVLANAYNLAVVRLRLGDLDRSIKALEAGIDRGIWFSDYAFISEDWAALKERPTWRRFESRNAEAKARDQARVEPRLEVALPAGYDPDRAYPLFLALHGGGENLETFMPRWTSSALSRDFIVAYPQSTQLVAMNGYSWTRDMELSIQEIKAAYEDVVRRYSVATDEVVVGGFSSGAIASLEMVLRNTLPVRGFVVLCPAIPEGFTVDALAAVRDRGVRGTLLTTEMDPRLEEQERMARILEEAGLPHEFHVAPNAGHWYPDDLGDRIDRAVVHIRGGEGRSQPGSQGEKGRGQSEV